MFLNKSIKIKALAQLCGYSDDVLRRILKEKSISPKQLKKISDNLDPWVEDVMDYFTDMIEERNAIGV